MNKIFVFPFVFTAVMGAGLSIDDTQAADLGTVLVTGANRGIGLEFARQLDALGYTVIGTARSPEKAAELKELGVRIEQLDVVSDESVAALAKRLGDTKIDILINNAGMFERNHQTLAKVDFAVMERTFAVNSVGPMRVTRALMPNLQNGTGKTIVNISSQMGSVGKNGGGHYSYRASKAALNQLTVTLARELDDDGFTCVVMHPGWVRTDMGGENATYSTEESASGMIMVIQGLTTGDNGRFLDLKGEELPW